MKADWKRVSLCLLCFAAVSSSLGCAVTAFSMPAAGALPLLGAGLAWALGCPLLLARRRGALTGVCALAAAAGILTLCGQVLAPVRQAFAGIASQCAECWGLSGAPAWDGRFADITAVLGLTGAALILFGTAVLRARRGLTALHLLLLVPLAACAAVPDAQPSAVCVVVLAGSLFLLTLTAMPASAGGRIRVTSLGLIPTVLALALLLEALPPENYVNRADEVREKLADLAEPLLRSLSLYDDGIAAKIDLSALQDLPETEEPAAQVTVTRTGTVYLRVQDYDLYTGTAWTASSNRTETLAGLGDSAGTVTVVTEGLWDDLPLPCFPDGEILFTDGASRNTDGRTSVTLTLREEAMGGQPDDVWLSLPESMVEQARLLAMSVIPVGADTDCAARAAAAFVSAAAAYSASPSRMPRDADDFTLWFLNEAEAGYCTHFATAAAVLLRAYGIPARFVTGYRVEALAGETVTVTEADAHAWVEYYNYQTWSWSVLEATPGLSDPADPTEPSEPAETTVPTEPPTTAPTETTAPPPTTEPPEQDPEEGKPFPWQLLLLPLLAAVPELQYRFRAALRRRLQHTGTPKRQALRRWREVRRLSRLAGVRPPAALEALTQKAVFSRNSVSAGDLRRMDAGITSLRRLLKKRPLPLRLLSRFVFAEA